MKTKSLKTLLVIILLTGFGTQLASARLQDIKKENRKVDTFSSIVLAISGDLYLSQGDKNEVLIEADDDVLENIITEVQGNTLIIKFEKWYNYKGNKKINIYVTTKTIEELTLTGSGQIINKTPINAPELELVITGSGSILLDNLNTKDVKTMISGSGNIKIKSDVKANSFESVITGSGDIDVSLISFEKADLTITGSGSIMAKVLDELDATITGSGKIKYLGKPIIDANITGSGKIINGN
jgi:hypothetical protein